MRWLRRAGIALGVVLLLALVAGVLAVRRPFPQTDGELALPGLDAPVEVTRDADGVPHITASTPHDLFLAQGFVHAQDRFWQMDFWRHIGSGRLSEMFGAGQVETDAFLRTLGWEEIAREEYETMPGRLRRALDAYTEGVNAWLQDRGSTDLSLEHTVLRLQNPGYTPEPWEPIHSLTWSKVMAWDLRANIEDEIARAQLSQDLGRERTEELYPPYPPRHPVIVPGSATAASPPAPALPAGAAGALAEVADRLAAVDEVLGEPFEGIGSNNWVISGERTASGSPLLANDPHLGIQMPSIWYQASLRCEPRTDACPYRVAGFSFAGVPGIVVGHNDRVAWGVTNLSPDAMDLYVERLHPTDDDRYEVDGEWVEMETRTEVIDVAGGDPVEIEVRSTRHGPVISGRLGDLDGLEGGVDGRPERFAIALRWTALEPSTLFESVLSLDLAEDADDVVAALSRFDIAAQNVVYATVDGDIGYQATGEIPIRSRGDGRYPVPGWTGEYEWVGEIPYEDLPSLRNPAQGYIVTANQPVVDAAYPGFIGVDHAYGYRAARITELVAGLEDATTGDMVDVQMDARNGSAEALVPRLVEVTTGDAAASRLQGVLEAWSQGPDAFQMDADSPGAAAYGVVWRQLLAATFEELGDDQAPGGGSRWFEVTRRLLDRPDDRWWDDTRTDRVEDRDEILRRVLIDAAAELEERLGADPEGWRWGDLHRAVFENETLGRSGIAPIEALFNRSAPPEVSGGAAIVNANGWNAAAGYDVIAIPSMRMVVDLGDLAGSVAINATGQSGHAFHPHYADQIADWATGGTRPLRWTDAQIGADADGVLRLVPDVP